jgi:hypothetical protein
VATSFITKYRYFRNWSKTIKNDDFRIKSTYLLFSFVFCKKSFSGFVKTLLEEKRKAFWLMPRLLVEWHLCRLTCS